jgi:hypothetical protein
MIIPLTPLRSPGSYPPFHPTNSYNSHIALPITYSPTSAHHPILPKLERSEVRHTLTLIHFLQYVHLTVCLIMGSLEKSSYALAIAYKARPTPRKLMSLLRNALFLCQHLFSKFTIHGGNGKRTREGKGKGRERKKYP